MRFVGNRLDPGYFYARLLASDTSVFGQANYFYVAQGHQIFCPEFDSAAH